MIQTPVGRMHDRFLDEIMKDVKPIGILKLTTRAGNLPNTNGAWNRKQDTSPQAYIGGTGGAVVQMMVHIEPLLVAKSGT